VCACEQKNYEMNKCLSLVHLISTIGPESRGSDELNSRSLDAQTDLDSADTKSDDCWAGKSAEIVVACSRSMESALTAG
jgi:hypothetical protein